MNERTHFFIKIYLSHFIRKGWCWLCVRSELETGIDCYILTQSSSDHSSTSFASWLGCSTVGHWGLQADSHAGILSPTDSKCDWNWTDSSHLWHLVIFLFDAHLLPVGVRICTEFNHVHRSRWYSDIFNRMHLFRCSSTYLHWCISWLTARSRVNMLQLYSKNRCEKFN